MRKVRFAARDPGAANVLAAFLETWTGGPDGACDIWAMPQAAPRLGATGHPVRIFNEPPTAAELASAWAADPADALVTGTSHYEPFESRLWDVARRTACPSLALVDYWSNLAERFRDGRPDAVGAIDDVQARSLETLGFDRSAILRVGQPWLAASARHPVKAAAAVGQEADAASTRVLFLSEPIASDVAHGANLPYGFDEFDVFTVVHAAVRRAVAAGARVSLVVKFHPYEQAGPFERRAAALETAPAVDVRFVAPAADVRPWLEWADLVIGIGSVALLEALLAGRPAVSLQPGLVRDNLFPPASAGCADVLSDPAIAAEYLTSLILDPASRAAVVTRAQPFVDGVLVDGRGAIAGWIAAQFRAADVRPV